MKRLHAFLFGAIERIDIHADHGDPTTLARQALASCGSSPGQVPVAVKPALLGCSYVLVQYGAGLFRGAHADVMVLP
jgi:hypothetical protein